MPDLRPSSNEPQNAKQDPAKPIDTCAKCGGAVTHPYCGSCGHPQRLRRIDNRYLIEEAGKALNLDRGIFYSLMVLIKSPGRAVRHYIHHDRTKLVKPIVFLILCSVIYQVVERYVSGDPGYIQLSLGEGSIGQLVAEWISDHYGYLNLLIALFMGLWMKYVFFRKKPYNLHETIILLFYLLSINMLLLTFFAVIGGAFGWGLSGLGSFVSICYIAWGINRFYEQRGMWKMIKGMLCYTLGVLGVAITLGMVASILELMAG